LETARLANGSELDALVALWERAVGELDGQRGGALLAGGLARSDVREFLAASVAEQDRAVVIGLIDDVAVGIATAFAQPGRRERIGALEVIYVDPSARQVGVAEAMLSTVLDWCRERGLVGLDAPALPGNRAAKAFFEGHGFLARLLVMHRPVGSSDGPAPG